MFKGRKGFSHPRIIRPWAPSVAIPTLPGPQPLLLEPSVPSRHLFQRILAKIWAGYGKYTLWPNISTYKNNKRVNLLFNTENAAERFRPFFTGVTISESKHNVGPINIHQSMLLSEGYTKLFLHTCSPHLLENQKKRRGGDVQSMSQNVPRNLSVR